jgi:MFS family permease
MTSLCMELWQTILAQAVGTGLGLGLVFLPALSVISEHFYHRRSLAMGIAQTGACVGGQSLYETPDWS